MSQKVIIYVVLKIVNLGNQFFIEPHVVHKYLQILNYYTKNLHGE